MLVAAEIDGRVIGTLQLTFIPGLSFRGAWRGLIEAVRIHSDVRGQRLGEQLIDWAVERCRERDCFLVQLTSSNERTDAHRFYKRLGWAQSHTGFKLKLREPR
jgi:GNAT superfamily N-acetyltransferase